MRNLKTIFAEIEKAQNYIERAKQDLVVTSDDKIIEMLNDFIARKKGQKQELQKEFNALYEKLN